MNTTDADSGNPCAPKHSAARQKAEITAAIRHQILTSNLRVKEAAKNSISIPGPDEIFVYRAPLQARPQFGGFTQKTPRASLKHFYTTHVQLMPSDSQHHQHTRTRTHGEARTRNLSLSAPSLSLSLSPADRTREVLYPLPWLWAKKKKKRGSPS